MKYACNNRSNEKSNFNQTFEKKDQCTQTTNINTKENPIEPQNIEQVAQPLTNETQTTNQIIMKLHNPCQCRFCSKTFSRKDSLQRHLSKYCKEARNERLIQELEQEIQILKEQNKNLLKGVKSYNPWNSHKNVNALLRRDNASQNKRFLKHVGCTVSFLYNYLQVRFKTGMTWENRGCWHIDHRKPIDKFDLNDEMERIQCCHYTNYQPLWANKNLRKGCKFNKNDFDFKWTENGWVQKL